jgi:hypothetical protein
MGSLEKWGEYENNQISFLPVLLPFFLQFALGRERE